MYDVVVKKVYVRYVPDEFPVVKSDMRFSKFFVLQMLMKFGNTKRTEDLLN